MRRSGMAERYVPLGNYLARQADMGLRRVELSFAEIEVAILGHPLPSSARRQRTWWQNGGTQTHAWYGWLRAGWFVGAISLATETATFSRGDDAEDG